MNKSSPSQLWTKLTSSNTGKAGLEVVLSATESGPGVTRYLRYDLYESCLKKLYETEELRRRAQRDLDALRAGLMELKQSMGGHNDSVFDLSENPGEGPLKPGLADQTSARKTHSTAAARSVDRRRIGDEFQDFNVQIEQIDGKFSASVEAVGGHHHGYDGTDGYDNVNSRVFIKEYGPTVEMATSKLRAKSSVAGLPAGPVLDACTEATRLANKCFI